MLLGCGHSRERKLSLDGNHAFGPGLVTLDMNPEVKPDIVHHMGTELPFDDDAADEIHAYDVLEHTGQQGDWMFFFAQWMTFWRVLKPGGLFFALVPRADRPWAWADPGHTRVILPETLTFLHQPNYTAECRPGGTNRTDYRRWFRGDFDLVAHDIGEVQFAFVLRAVKPSRITVPER